MAQTPEEIIREEIRTLAAYRVPENKGLVKLDAMENPHLLPQALRQEIAALISEIAINRYPDSQAITLKSRLRDVMQIPLESEIILGNGSDELIQIVAMASARPGACLMSVEPSFSMFRMVGAFVGMRYVGVNLNQDFSLPLERLLDAMAEHKPSVIFLACPNNPTGNLFDSNAMLCVIESAPGLVVVDEAYVAFSDSSFMEYLPMQKNLLIMRTLSKSGLAGLRLGYLLGNKKWLAHFEKLRLPYNINVLTQLIAGHILTRYDVLKEQVEKIKAERIRLTSELGEIVGINVYPSRANFVLLQIANADKVFSELRRNNILVKNLHNTHVLLDNCLRVTVGTVEENEHFLATIKGI